MSASAAITRPGIEISGWKAIVGHFAAVIVAILFLSSGIWKISDPFGWARMVEEFLVPPMLSLPFALALGIAETAAGVLVLIPSVRRWGALLASLLLIVFMIYIGFEYNKLVGKDCSCFPLVKRAVTPAFFLEDGVMLAAAIAAGWFARAATGTRTAILLLSAIVVASGTSFGYALAHQSGTKAPSSITVDGKPYSLEYGRIFIFFYDPNCGHCDAAARSMSKLHWKDDVAVVAIPTQNPRFAAAFLRDTGLKALTSLDLDPLKKTFPFGDPPYGVAIENGHAKAPVPHYEGSEPADTLRRLGFIE